MKYPNLHILRDKQQWKLLLALGASLVVLVSLWYTNLLVTQIASEERDKISLWAEAIQKKNALVNYTIVLFDKLGVEEEKKVTLWAEATRYLATSNTLDDYTFILQVVHFNSTVPVITTDKDGHIKEYRNMGREYDLQKDEDLQVLQEKLSEMKSLNKPIEIAIYGDDKDYLYYGTSTIITDLRDVLDNLVQSFIGEIVVNSASVPVILTDSTGVQVISFGNVDSLIIGDPEKRMKLIAEMANQNDPIPIEISGNVKQYIFYKDSELLIQLRYYPFFQLGIIALFLLLAYYLFSTSRRAEQNQVWVGMSKETAHQLGTPISSLLAWQEIIKEKLKDDKMVDEMGRDLARLEVITERFSKIGSEPDLDDTNLVECIENVSTYLRKRLSKNVKLVLKVSDKPIRIKLNAPLFEWVLENIIKNGADSMSGNGRIVIVTEELDDRVFIDISDTGKGIKKSHWKSVFDPGFTTKKRGWGLGLSLVKRIVENYHKGKVFVKDSEINEGATFRIILFKK
ncbi:MAG: HAMP domain-containing sensor histidine kinase [Vicingaceae bacterium]